METNENLTELEAAVQERERKVKEKEAEIASRERDVASAQSNLKNLKAILEKEIREAKELKNNYLAGQDKEIKNRDKDIRDLDSRILSLKRQIADLDLQIADEKARKDVEINNYELEKREQIDKTLTTKIQKDNDAILKDFENKIEQMTSAVSWSKETLNKAFEDLISEYEDMLHNKEEIYNEKLKDVEAAKNKFEEEIAKSQSLETEKAEIKIKQKKLDKQQQFINYMVTKEVNEKYKEIIEENRESNLRYDSLNREYEQLKTELTNLRDLARDAKFADNIKFKKDFDDLNIRYESLMKKYTEYSSNDLAEIKAKASQYDTLKLQLQQKCQELNEASNQVTMLQTAQNNVDALKFKNTALTNQIKVQQDILDKLKIDIESLENRLDNKKINGQIAVDIETVPYDFKNLPQDKNIEIDEVKWLDQILNKCKEAGYQFSERLFYSFHTSLLSSDMSPLTVLAGVSGTGKSKLPQLYSKFGGLYFISVPVKPDYDGPQSLFGYFNSIDRRFNATSLTQALVPFQKDKSKSLTSENIEDLSDNVLLVLLDEMNLAHIELYFSDLLSKLEERRDGNDNVCEELDMGAGNPKYRIALTDNVKWLGTMNEDETTKSLSDKVIDRGNIICFPRPVRFERYVNRNKKAMPPDREKISKRAWNKWVNNKVELTDDEVNKYMDIIVNINVALGKANRAIGHRVWQSIENYIISHPLVKKFANVQEKREKAIHYAFEEAVVYKIMPKLRGIDTDGSQREECLDVIEKILEENEFTTIIDDYKKAMDSVTNTFYWNSSEFLNTNYDMEE